MARDANTPEPEGDPYIVPVAAGTPMSAPVGGKGRSLARLAALGLPVPAAFAISPALFTALRASGPPLPDRLETAADLAALDRAQDAVRGAALPEGAGRALDRALVDLERRFGRGSESLTFAVRSSADTEDRRGVLGAGVYASLLRVPRADVAAAMRTVLASYLTPAAWAYGLGSGPAAPGRAAGGPEVVERGGAVLIHPFVEGRSWGAAAIGWTSPIQTPSAVGLPPPDKTGLDPVQIETTGEPLTPVAYARIADAAHQAASTCGPVELEWVADGDRVVFLQMRAYEPPSPLRSRPAHPETVSDAADLADAMNVADAVAAADIDSDAADGAPVDPSAFELSADFPGAASGWIWDAAHNPAPLSPAQAGLVQLVDDRCRVGFRQRIFGGYLFYRPGEGADTPNDHGSVRSAPPDGTEPAAGGGDPAAALARLRADVQNALDALGPQPAVQEMLELFVRAYQPLFGDVGAACSAARTALAEFLDRRFPGDTTVLPALLAGVRSVATDRRDAIAALVAARAGADSQAALDDYLSRFGDESPRWDVAEPTLAEAPARLLWLTAARGNPRSTADGESEAEAEVDAAPPPRGAAPATTAASAAADVRAKLPAAERTRFDALLTAARRAVAVGEDDDALFARLQAAVRRALLDLGRRLAAAGCVDAPDDVFYLPLAVTRTLAPDGSQPPPSAMATTDGGPGTVDPTRGQLDLRRLVATGRQTFVRAQAAPPAPPRLRGSPIVGGLPGAGGRAIGRVVHHPAAVPLDAGTVLVAATLLPTELPLLAPGALVVETGHALGHVAAQARERGIPAVVGAAGARVELPEGALVLVDGDRGQVIRLQPLSPARRRRTDTPG